jgi:hypothetical protein
VPSGSRDNVELIMVLIFESIEQAEFLVRSVGIKLNSYGPNKVISFMPFVIRNKRALHFFVTNDNFETSAILMTSSDFLWGFDLRIQCLSNAAVMVLVDVLLFHERHVYIS